MGGVGTLSLGSEVLELGQSSPVPDNQNLIIGLERISLERSH